MNTRKRLLNTLGLGAMVIGFALSLAGWRAEQIPAVSAQEPPRERQRGIATFFGMQTLAPRQTAQITVVNPSEIIPCVRVRMTFDIYEQDPPTPIRPGETDTPEPDRLRFVRSVSREVELDPGEAASFDYTAHGRGEFVSPASFAIEENEVGDPHRSTRGPDADPLTPIRTRATAASSTLVINERGHAPFSLPGVRVSFDPQPDPPSPN